MKENTWEWFDGNVLDILNLGNKLFKKFKKLRLHIDKELYKKSKYDKTDCVKKASLIRRENLRNYWQTQIIMRIP